MERSWAHNGQWVVTRRGKRGQVVRAEASASGTILVRFGSREFELPYSSVVSADSYDRAGRGYSPQVYR